MSEVVLAEAGAVSPGDSGVVADFSADKQLQTFVLILLRR